MMEPAIANTSSAVRACLERAPTPLRLLRQAAVRYPDHPALVYLCDADSGHRVTVSYAQLLAETEAVARALRASGVTPEDGVAMFLPLVPEAVSALIAACAVGVAFPVNLLMSEQAIASQLALARCKVVITVGSHAESDLSERISAAAASLPRPPHVVVLPLGDAEKATFDGEPWPAFVAKAGDAALAADDDPERVAALLHTGGTTYAPKLAELTLGNLAAGGVMTCAGCGYSQGDRLLNGLPLFHVGSSVDAVLAIIAAGATLVLPTALGLKNPAVIRRFWSMLDALEVTLVGGVPTTLSTLADAPRQQQRCASLRAFLTGGSALNPQLARRLETISGAPVYQLYGMTESAGIVTAQFIDGMFRPPLAGHPVPLVEVAIEEPGRPLRAGQRGELWVRGPNVFVGYRTATGTQDRPHNGWIPSGDLVTVTDDGQLRIVGRTKEVIIRSGHNIDPQMLEQVAEEHPAVLEAAVVAMPDQYAGELPVLYVTLRAGADERSVESIDAFVRDRIAVPQARPRHVFVLPSMPVTPLGKVARYQLRQKAVSYRAGQLIAELDTGARVSCPQPDAKSIVIDWSSSAAAAMHDRARERLAEFGLVLMSA
ncbi:AMP-binding protein [Alloalcanivorax balearicus]|nr:AMP-binding protein [Alloalcanivorax balearicus]